MVSDSGVTQLPETALFVENPWADYDGHMHLACYVLVSDQATDIFYDRLGIDPDYRQAQASAMFTVFRPSLRCSEDRE